ncbi:holo-ACP synthase [Skermania piniformis]|nr:holo-ACP synthase [Skermania piniformis]
MSDELGMPVRRARAVGCDLVALTEVADALAAFGDRYLTRIFTDREIAACTGVDRVARLAARFAAKESVIKALQIVDDATPLREIEVVSDAPVPRLELHGTIRARAAERGYTEFGVSLSHTDCHAMAVVVAE